MCNTICNAIFYIHGVGITISIHAREQAAKRSIPEDDIIAILSDGRPTMTLPSKTDPEAVVVFGRHGGKTWGVVMNVNTQNVITVRIASKKERRLYEQETGN